MAGILVHVPDTVFQITVIGVMAERFGTEP